MMTRSISKAGASYSGRAATAVSAGAGKALRSSLPTAEVGSRASTEKLGGTMYSGSCSLRKAVSRAPSSAASSSAALFCGTT